MCLRGRSPGQWLEAPARQVRMASSAPEWTVSISQLPLGSTDKVRASCMGHSLKQTISLAIGRAPGPSSPGAWCNPPCARGSAAQPRDSSPGACESGTAPPLCQFRSWVCGESLVIRAQLLCFSPDRHWLAFLPPPLPHLLPGEWPGSAAAHLGMSAPMRTVAGSAL